MITADAVSTLETTTRTQPSAQPMNPQQACAALESTVRSYTNLKPADALAHLNEHLAAEVERFERDTGLVLASVKVNRDKEAGTLKSLQAHVR